MSKDRSYKKLLVQRKRERKRLNRLRKDKSYKDIFTTLTKPELHKIFVDDKIISNLKFELDEFINENGNNKAIKSLDLIEIPKIFSLEFKHKVSIDVLSTIRKSLLNNLGKEIKLDFTKCIEIDFSILFLLKIILEEYLLFLNKANNNTFRDIVPRVNILPSETELVNIKLYANSITKNASYSKSELLPVFALNLIKGSKSKKHYTENKKGSAITNIRNFINETCLKRQNLVLSDTEIGNLDGLLSEILNNAEDHSPFNTWYAYGNLFETKGTKEKDIDNVGEVNLAIFNFGYSIFDGFEKTKVENKQKYDEMEKIYNHLISNSKEGSKFTKENLFTLTALQEGFSRVKFKDKSRGTGTMKFLNSFIELGDYQDKKKNYNPRLLIYSGNTMIKCDNEFKPFEISGDSYLSLNPEKDLSLPPKKSHLQNLDRRFPGTLLVVKIYLNESHLIKKIESNGN